MFEDAMTYPEHIIKELKARVLDLEDRCRELEKKNERLSKDLWWERLCRR